MAVQLETDMGPFGRRAVRAKDWKTEILARSGSIFDGCVYINTNRLTNVYSNEVVPEPISSD